MKWGLYGIHLVDARAELLSLDETLQQAFDPYAFVRDAYLSRRAYLVSDGKVSADEPLVDPGDPDSDKPTSSPAPTTPQPR